MFKTRVSVANGVLTRRSQPGNYGVATPQYLSRGQAPLEAGVSRGKKETAMFGGDSMSISQPGGASMTTMFRGIIPDNSGDDAALGVMLRDIWHYDNVGGSAVDLQCGLAFSGWTLTGVDQEIAEVYSDSMTRLDIRLMLPQISRNFLVDGAFIGTLLYDKDTNGFQDVLVHDRFNATISPQPLFSVDPVVVVNSANNLRQFLDSNSPYASISLRGYPRKILENFMQGSNVLDPVTTLLALRKGTQESACVSYLRRLLPMYMLEKTLFRGTLTEAAKRQRATTQIVMGTDTWEPTVQEMMEYTQKFQMSDMDPLGAWVATRQGVTLNDIRPPGEIWKWTDSADVLVPYKLRALGISEAFLSSDATYANAESSLTMFMDNLDSYREFLTHKLFYSKLFPLIAITNGFYKEKTEIKNKGSLEALLFNMRNTKNLKMPTIQWTKNLKTPNSAQLIENLEKLTEKGFPVGLKTWAAAANIDLSASLFDLAQDKEIREQISSLAPKPEAPPDEEGGGGMEEEASVSLDDFRKRVEMYPMKSALATPTPNLLSREFGGDFKYNKTGNPVPASPNEARMANEKIVKAFKALSDPHRFAEVKKNIIAKHGYVPKIGW
jgi:hypothetical protein